MTYRATDRGLRLAIGGVSLAVAFAGVFGLRLMSGPAPLAAAQQAAGGDRASSDSGAAVRAAVEGVIRAQEEAWNRGDVDEFVKYYWKSDDVTFSSGGKVTRGWTATANNYRERYPTREAMGRVTFSNLETTPLGDEAALMLGEWKLDRKDEPMGGNFTLVFRKIDGQWVVIHDHTSRLVE